MNKSILMKAILDLMLAISQALSALQAKYTPEDPKKDLSWMLTWQLIGPIIDAVLKLMKIAYYCHFLYKHKRRYKEHTLERSQKEFFYYFLKIIEIINGASSAASDAVVADLTKKKTAGRTMCASEASATLSDIAQLSDRNMMFILNYCMSALSLILGAIYGLRELQNEYNIPDLLFMIFNLLSIIVLIRQIIPHITGENDINSEINQDTNQRPLLPDGSEWYHTGKNQEAGRKNPHHEAGMRHYKRWFNEREQQITQPPTELEMQPLRQATNYNDETINDNYRKWHPANNRLPPDEERTFELKSAKGLQKNKLSPT